MKPDRKLPLTLLIFCLGFLLQHLTGAIAVHAQQVQVTAAIPAAAEQGTVNLNVKVTGKGFKNGAKAKWFVTGTTDTGGVTVNSTTFVSSSEVTANITVSDTAVIANFDIQVLNSDGRGGKGTELFRVTAKGGGNADCPPMQPAPTGDTSCYGTSPGCLDTTFGGVGYVYIDPGVENFSEFATGVAVQPDGKIVVVSQARASLTNIDFAVIRYNTDGTLDNSFGDPDPFNPPLRRGYTVTSHSSGFDKPTAVVIQPDGRIVVVGAANTSYAVVVRYSTDGSLDSSFGNGGIVQLGSGAPKSDLALQADGRILIAGVPGQGGFGLVRLNTNGSLDSSFGSNGQVAVNASGVRKGSSSAWSLAIQRVPAATGEERIVVAGWSRLSLNDNQDWTLMRFRSNGAIDTSFGTNGVAKTFFLGFGDQARRVKIDSSNRIVAAGLVSSANSSCGSYTNDFGVVRYTQDGSLDGTFIGGKQTVDVYGGDDSLNGLDLQADGKILLFGTAYSSDNSLRHFGLVRLNVDGSRDASFALLGNGIVTTALYGLRSGGWALALDPAGRIVAAGAGYGASATTEDVVVARYWP